MSPIFRLFSLVLFAVLVCLVLAGCSSKPVVYKTQRVEVPVIVEPPPPPAELVVCGEDEPGFQFYAPLGEDDGAVLRRYDWDKFKSWIEGKNRCIDGWRRWSNPQ